MAEPHPAEVRLAAMRALLRLALEDDVSAPELDALQAQRLRSLLLADASPVAIMVEMDLSADGLASLLWRAASAPSLGSS